MGWRLGSEAGTKVQNDDGKEGLVIRAACFSRLRSGELRRCTFARFLIDLLLLTLASACDKTKQQQKKISPTHIRAAHTHTHAHTDMCAHTY